MTTPEWTMADIFADEGITGTCDRKRPEFLRMIRQCKQGKIDIVLTKSISRFARNTVDCLKYIRALKELGIAVIFEKENINTLESDSEIIITMMGAFAQGESESISANVKWGQRQAMREGKVVFQYARMYGYERGEDDKPKIIPERAVVIRRIFYAYLAGKSVRAIKEMLESEHILTSKGGETWSVGVLQGMLRNEKYIGDSLHQKTYRTDTLPTRELPNRGERDQYYAEDTHPAIVERTVYEAAQSLQKCRKEKYHTDPKTKRTPLGAALCCGVCGGNFRQKHISGRTYWLCRSHDTGKERCPITQIPEEEIHAAFLRIYYKLKHHGAPVLTEMLSQLSELRNRRMLWSEDVIALNKRIGDISEQNRLLGELKSSGLVDSVFYIRGSNELAEMLRIAKLEKERFSTMASISWWFTICFKVAP